MERLLELDGQFLLWLKDFFAHPLLDRMMIFVTSLANKGMLWIAIGILFLFLGVREKKWRERGLLVLLSLVLNAVVCNLLLKPLFSRTRPYDLLGYEILIRRLGDASFPSGHTSASFAAATALYAIDRRYGIAAYVLAVLIGFSRLYLGVHFPTDVFIGAIIGVLAAKAAQALLEKKLHFEFRSDK